MLQAVIPESATTQVKELFVLPTFIDAARTEAQSLPLLEVSEVCAFMFRGITLPVWNSCQLLLQRSTLPTLARGVAWAPVIMYCTHLTYWLLGPTHPTCQTASRSVQPFLQVTCPLRDRQTDRPRHTSVAIDRIYAMHTMQPNNTGTRSAISRTNPYT